MGNQGKMARNLKFKTMNNIIFLKFSKTEDMHSKVRQNKVEENSYWRNYFIKTSSAIRFL